MCDLHRNIDKESFVGYKLVAEEIETGKNYSLAMGFCYDDYDRIPIIEKQKRLTTGFVDDLLYRFFVKEMKGRTSVYKDFEDANYNFLDMKLTYSMSPGFKLKLKKAKVSIDLMGGDYGVFPIISGRKIEFLEDVTED